MAHNLSMGLKHLLNLKQKDKQPPQMHMVIYWLGKAIYNYNNDYYHLKTNNIIKTTKQTTPFYYRDLAYYIKTQNPNITNIKNETKSIYKRRLQKGSQDHITFGETWKNKITNLDFIKIWKNMDHSYSQPHNKDLLYKLLNYATKTNNYTYKISRNKTGLNPSCELCNKTGDNLHFFTTCSRIQNIWKYF